MPRTGARLPISSFSMVDFPAPFSPTCMKKHKDANECTSVGHRRERMSSGESHKLFEQLKNIFKELQTQMKELVKI